MNDTGPSTAGSPALQVNVPLALLAQDVTSEAGRLGESVAVHLGWEVAWSADPEARRLTALGAGFDWVAFAVPGTSMWNLHVGVLHMGGDVATIGLHLHESFGLQRRGLDLLAKDLGADLTFSEIAREHQLTTRSVNLSSQRPEAVATCLSLHRQCADLVH